MLEFALCLPLFLGFVLAAIEMSNYVLAINRTQRLATMSADLVAQSGTGQISATEGQIYDLFSAIDLTAQPFDIRNHGRVVLTGIKGTETSKGKVENFILWQRFDGNYVNAAPVVGCKQTDDIAKLPNNRKMSLDEIMFHAQVTYEYQPIFSGAPFHWLDLPVSFTRTAMFRARSSQFQSPNTQAGFPAKKKCTSANGL